MLPLVHFVEVDMDSNDDCTAEREDDVEDVEELGSLVVDVEDDEHGEESHLSERNYFVHFEDVGFVVLRVHVTYPNQCRENDYNHLLPTNLRPYLTHITILRIIH